jgi:hypothetical protein
MKYVRDMNEYETKRQRITRRKKRKESAEKVVPGAPDSGLAEWRRQRPLGPHDNQIQSLIGELHASERVRRTRGPTK